MVAPERARENHARYAELRRQRRCGPQRYARGAAVGTSSDERTPGGRRDASFRQRIVSHVDSTFQGLSNNITAIEHTIETMQQHANQFERSVAADLLDIEESIKVQATILESARTAMSQTDDLVERVVEALESLQSAVLDSNEAPAEPIAFAVN